MPGTRVLVLGIDAASPLLIERGMEDGSLPNLRALADRGLHGPVSSIEGFFIGSTWPSFQTGVSPARHGLHYLTQLQPGTYAYYLPADGDYIRSPTFWSHLSRAGLKVAVLDVPLSRLDPQFDGIHVVEWGGHDAVFGFRAIPAYVEAEILSRFGSHPFQASCDSVERTAGGYAAFTDALVRGVRTRADLTRHFLNGGDWDFFMQVFTEAHCAGHQCWHLQDANHPSHDPAMVEAIGNPIHRVYSAIDQAIGGILDDAGDAIVFVLAAHGMSHAFGAHFLLHDMLFGLGVSTPPADSPDPRGLRAGLLGSARQVWRRLPGSLRARLAPLRTRLTGRSTESTLPRLRVDTRTSQCFPVHNGLAAGGIRLNLIGREPTGILDPRDADAFCDGLRDALLSFVDDETGERVVRSVRRTAEIVTGKHLDALPDLIVEWTDTRKLGTAVLAGGAGSRVRIRSPRTGLIEGTNDYGRTGEHRVEGMFVVAGPGIVSGCVDHMTSVMDFASTFSALLGVDPSPCDGEPIAALAGIRAPARRS